jgi:hypothetical protein
VLNPKKALYNVQDWLEAVINQVKSLLREYIATKTYEELLVEQESIGEAIKTRLKERGWFDTFRCEYGVEIVEKTWLPDGTISDVEAIKVRDITPPAEHQRAATKKKLAEWERDRIIGETMGSLAKMLGLSPEAAPEEIETKLNNNPKAAEVARDFIHRRMGIDGGAYVDVRVPGTSAIGTEIIKILAAWKRMPDGGGKREEKEGGGEEPSDSGKEEKDKDKEGEGKEISNPVQRFFHEKRPMEKIHKQKKKRGK